MNSGISSISQIKGSAPLNILTQILFSLLCWQYVLLHMCINIICKCHESHSQNMFIIQHLLCPKMRKRRHFSLRPCRYDILSVKSCLIEEVGCWHGEWQGSGGDSGEKACEIGYSLLGPCFS